MTASSGRPARLVASMLLLLGGATPTPAQQVNVQEVVLDNGLRVLMVPRGDDPNVAAGWVARVGSVNERPGITGMSHLFEHMMFKGTRVVGTTDIDKDLALLKQMDEVKAQIRVEELALAGRVRLGEVLDPNDPASRSPRHRELLAKLTALEKEEKGILVPNDFDRIYTAAGASGMNAGTTEDFTIYYINVPANKLELWFWMESDRLLNPVFREFYSERDVVREERRLRVESTPTGKLDEQFEALFWTSSPYHWPVIGWPSDVEAITREQAEAYFGIYYAPNNLTACLVGDFDPAEATALAQKYFGRIPRGALSPPPVVTEEVAHLAERRLVASAETLPQVELRWLSVPDGHADEPALIVLSDLLNGRTGRLYLSLVVGQQVASNAGAFNNGLKYQGYFSASGVARADKTPEQVEQALYKEIERLQTEPVGDRELQKIKNRTVAASVRRLQSNFGLMQQLLVADAYRGWRSFNDDPKRLDAVTAADVMRVARTYLTPESRTVAIYYTKKANATTDPTLEGLTDEQQQQIQTMGRVIGQMPVEKAKEMLMKVEQESASSPEEKKMIEAIKLLLQRRIAGGGK